MTLLLLDANLSWRLVRLLESHFHEIHHVDKIGLPFPAKDIDIWNWASSRNAIIVTNDEDFYYLLSQKGFPPKVVILRTGNQATQDVADLLIKHQEQIKELQESTEYGILEIY